MTFIPGVNSWTPNQYRQKQKAVSEGQLRKLARIKQAETGEEVRVLTDTADLESAWSYSLDAECHLLSYLNFPSRLKPFLDTILASACGIGSERFSATNLEIGQKVRSGHERCSDGSMEKWVCRQKEKLQAWQVARNFQLVEIIDGAYDWETKRRQPTEYRVHLNSLVAKAYELAQSKFYWRTGDEYRKFRNRAIREASRQIINELPTAPNLAPKPKKTLTEQQQANRKFKAGLNLMSQALEHMKRAGIDAVLPAEYAGMGLIAIASNRAGILMTPERDRPMLDLDYWRLSATGEIVELTDKLKLEIDRKLDHLEAVDHDLIQYSVDSPKSSEVSRGVGRWEDGQMTYTNDTFEKPAPCLTQDEVSGFPEQFDAESAENDLTHDFTEVCADMAESSDHTDIFVLDAPETDETIRTNLSGVKHFEDDQPDKNVRMVGEETDQPDKNVRMVSEIDLLFPPDEPNSPAELIAHVAPPDPAPPSFEECEAIYKEWCVQIREKIPPQINEALEIGCWQMNFGDPATDESAAADEAVFVMAGYVAAGLKPLSELKRTAVESFVHRATYWKGGLPQHATNKQAFRRRLQDFLQLPERE